PYRERRLPSGGRHRCRRRHSRNTDRIGCAGHRERTSQLPRADRAPRRAPACRAASRREPCQRAGMTRTTEGRRDRSSTAARSIPIEGVLLPGVIESDDEDCDEHDYLDEACDAERAEEHGPREKEDHFHVEHDEEERKHVEVRRISSPRLTDGLFARLVGAELFLCGLPWSDKASER